MSYKQLTQEEAQKAFDYVDGKLFWKPRLGGRWDSRWVGKMAGRTKPDGRMDISYNNVRYKYHRIVWNWHYGEIPYKMEIDHINGNPSDNRIANLRLCKHQENMLNRKMQSNNKCSVKNVYYSKDRNLWVVDIRSNGVRHISEHKTLESAAKTAKIVRIKLHNEFANHGIISPNLNAEAA